MKLFFGNTAGREQESEGHTAVSDAEHLVHWQLRAHGMNPVSSVRRRPEASAADVTGLDQATSIKAILDKALGLLLKESMHESV